MELENKVVIITGASSGIGKELAVQMARKGAKVVLAARDVKLLEEAAAQIKKAGGEAFVVPTDVSKRVQVEQLVHAAVIRYGRLDVMVNNAGVSLGQGNILENNEADFRATMEINFMGCVYGVWAAGPVMAENGGGLLVFVSSVVGKRAVPKSSSYCASKFALQGFTESIRPELAVKNIRVITVCPPGVDTPFFKKNGREDRRRFRLHPVEKIAAMILRACEKETREALLTVDAHLLHWGNVFFPRFMDWAAAKGKGVK